MGSVMTRIKVDRVAFRAAIVLAGCLLLGTAWVPAASADPSCASGSLAALVGTTCDIGPLQFTFGALTSDAYIGVVGGSSSSSSPWTASAFFFAPVSNGFIVSFDGGPLSVTAPIFGGADDEAILAYSVIDLDGDLTGESVSGGLLSAAANGGFASAVYEGFTYSATGDSSIFGFNRVIDGIPSSYQIGLQGAPFSVGAEGEADLFLLNGENGGTAGWDGTPTTFTFGSTPEPSSLLLFATGLLGIVFITRKKLAR
jgi:PEP-CTERM motif